MNDQPQPSRQEQVPDERQELDDYERGMAMLMLRGHPDGQAFIAQHAKLMVVLRALSKYTGDRQPAKKLPDKAVIRFGQLLRELRPAFNLYGQACQNFVLAVSDLVTHSRLVRAQCPACAVAGFPGEHEGRCTAEEPAEAPPPRPVIPEEARGDKELLLLIGGMDKHMLRLAEPLGRDLLAGLTGPHCEQVFTSLGDLPQAIGNLGNALAKAKNDPNAKVSNTRIGVLFIQALWALKTATMHTHDGVQELSGVSGRRYHELEDLMAHHRPEPRRSTPRHVPDPGGKETPTN